MAVVGAVLLTAAALPGHTALAAETASPAPYAFAEDARSVEGATTSADAELLEPGSSYRSSLPSNSTLYYRLELDAKSTTYISATAVPRAGTTVGANDSLKVSVEDADGNSCSFETNRFGASRSPHPIATWGKRDPAASVCSGTGTYYVLVERVDTTGSSPDAWDLELVPVSEPPLTKAGPSSAPEVWDSASPAALTGEARPRAGGAGFDRASSVGQGVWDAGISAGQTLFYKVPLDWGRQLDVTAELASSSSGGNGYVTSALNVSLYNPVRAPVDDASRGYTGTQLSVALDPLPPVEYANRYAVSQRVNGMRFAGSYYLVVHLGAQMAGKYGGGPFELTLRVRVGGTAEAAPGYAGESEPGDVFGVTAQDREAATPTGAGGSDTTMTLVAAGGIGAGTVLLAGLGLWTVLARRKPAGVSRAA